MDNTIAEGLANLVNGDAEQASTAPKDTPDNNKRSFPDLYRDGFGNGKPLKDMSESERFERACNFKISVFNRISDAKAKQSEEEPKFPKSRSWDDLEDADLTELKIVLEDILNQGAKMTVGGSSKIGKTWILMDFAVSVATGMDWLGYKTRKGKVFYANLEIQEQYFRKRGKSIKHAKGIKEETKIPNLYVWTLRGHHLTAEGFKKSILEEIGDQKFDVIIIDPVYKLLDGGDANTSGVMQKILSELERIAFKAEAALVYAERIVNVPSFTLLFQEKCVEVGYD